jgi:hypothetical protein
MPNGSRKLSRIELKPTREKSALLFRLEFRSSAPRPPTIEFELESAAAMNLLSALQSIQRQTGWRVPQFFAGRGLKPVLRLIRNEPS